MRACAFVRARGTEGEKEGGTEGEGGMEVWKRPHKKRRVDFGGNGVKGV